MEKMSSFLFPWKRADSEWTIIKCLLFPLSLIPLSSLGNNPQQWKGIVNGGDEREREGQGNEATGILTLFPDPLLEINTGNRKDGEPHLYVIPFPFIPFLYLRYHSLNYLSSLSSLYHSLYLFPILTLFLIPRG